MIITNLNFSKSTCMSMLVLRQLAAESHPLTEILTAVGPEELLDACHTEVRVAVVTRGGGVDGWVRESHSGTRCCSL